MVAQTMLSKAGDKMLRKARLRRTGRRRRGNHDGVVRHSFNLTETATAVAAARRRMSESPKFFFLANANSEPYRVVMAS